MKSYQLEYFTSLMKRGMEIVKYPTPFRCIRCQKSSLSIFDKKHKKSYRLHNIIAVILYSGNYTIVIRFKNGDNIILQFLTQKSQDLFYTYFTYVLEKVHNIPIDIQSFM